MLHQQSRLRPRSLKETDRHLFKQCRALHSIPIATLNRRTVAAQLTAIAQSSGPAAANRVRGSLGAFCSWAMKEGFRDDNPVSATNKATENGPRQRLLSDDELATIWRALRDDQYGAALKLLILTGLRRGEIEGLRWSEVDLETDLVSIPAARTKNGRPHLVPLSALARALLAAQPRDGDLVFGTKVIRWHLERLALDQRIAESQGEPLEAWVVHDIRRAFSTSLHDRLGVPPHVVEVLLGHVGHQAGVAGTYNKSVYAAECERALTRWAEHIEQLVSGRKPAPVVKLGKRR